MGAEKRLPYTFILLELYGKESQIPKKKKKKVKCEKSKGMVNKRLETQEGRNM